MDDKSDKDQICIQSTREDEEEEEWSVSCSDDEKYNMTLKSKAVWEPKPQEIIELYRSLDEKAVLELEWVCPGKRSPSPSAEEDEESSEDGQDSDSKKEPEPNEFDFDDSPHETTTITPRRTPGSAKLKGSGQKRTASLKNVMSNIFRHRKLQGLHKSSSSSSSWEDIAKIDDISREGDTGED